LGVCACAPNRSIKKLEWQIRWGMAESLAKAGAAPSLSPASMAPWPKATAMGGSIHG